MRTVAGLFDTYRQGVIPRTAPTVQVEECRRAFFAGVAAVLLEIQNSPDDLSDEETERQTLALLSEVAVFAAHALQEPKK